MKVVSDNSDADIQRARATEQVERALRDLAGNLLRVIRGAGAPGRISRQLGDLMDGFVAYRDAHGHYPSAWTIGEALSIDNAKIRELQSNPDKSESQLSYEIRLEAEDRIIRGALQIAASRLLGDRLRINAGEDELERGIRVREDAIAEERARILRELTPLKAAQRKQRKTKPRRRPKAHD